MTIRQLAKKYNKYIEAYEYDKEYTNYDDNLKPWYWVYLKEPYETDYGTTSIHDTLEIIKFELENIKERYEKEID